MSQGKAAVPDNNRTKQYPIPLAAVDTLIPAQIGTAARADAAYCEFVHDLLLQTFAPASVLVNRDYRILYYYSGRADDCLLPPKADQTDDLLTLAGDELRQTLCSALHRAFGEQQMATVSAELQRDDGALPLRVTVTPVRDPWQDALLCLVVFEVAELKSALEHTAPPIVEADAGHGQEGELVGIKRELESAVKELTAAKTRLEEQIAELERSHNGLDKLLSGTQSATLFLDRSLRIKGLTPSDTRSFNLIPVDINQPISDIAIQCADTEMIADARRVFETLAPIARTVRTKTGERYLRWVLPYHRGEDCIEGVMVTFADITEITRMAADTERLATVVKDSNDAVIVFEPNGRILTWNRSAQRMYGWSEIEALAMSLSELVPETLRAENANWLERLLQGEDVMTFETQRLTKSGRVLDVSLTATVLGQTADHLLAVATTERDVTERKRAEAKTRESEENFRAVLESAPDAMIVVDATGAIEYANARMETLFGYSLDELMSLRIEQLVPERFRALHAIHYAEYFTYPRARRMNKGLVLIGLHRSGQEMPLEISLGSINPGGKLRVSASIRDISERQRAEDALRSEKAFSESLIETAQAIVLLLDPDGRIAKVNPYFEKLTGYVAGEVLGQDWFEKFLPECDRPKNKVQFQAAIQTDILDSHIQPIVTKAGDRRLIEWSAKVLKAPRGEVGGLLNIGHDVTMRLEVTQALRRAKREAEQATIAKSRFLTAASHDMRQPLQAMSLYNAALKKTIRDDSIMQIVRGQREALDEIDALLNAYLDIGMIENGEITPKLSEFSVTPILERMHHEFALMARAKGLEFRLVSCGAAVCSDPALLERILENLVSNAVKYTETGKILVGCRRRGANLRIEVWDTGIGIPEGHLNAIFEEFYQLDNPARTRLRGLGLGLCIVDRLAQLLCHRIEVRSEPGKGTMFAVEAPVGTVQATVAEASAAYDIGAQPWRANLSVLLIEDNEAVADSFRLLLGMEKFSVTTASSGKDALNELDKLPQPPDVIISDYRLEGGETGLDVIGRLRAACGGSPIPAILITGDTNTALIGQAKAAGCRLLYKPIRHTALEATIRELLAPFADAHESGHQPSVNYR